MTVLNTRMKYLLFCLCCSIFDKMKVFPIPVFVAVRTSRIFTNSSYFRPYEVPYLLKSDKCRKYAKLGGSEVSGRGCLLHILLLYPEQAREKLPKAFPEQITYGWNLTLRIVVVMIDSNPEAKMSLFILRIVQSSLTMFTQPVVTGLF